MSGLRLRVATWNLRNVADRWPERRPLLAAAFRALAPDLCGLQEVALTGERQDDLLAATLGGHPRQLVAESPRFPGFGNAIIVGRGEVLAHEVVELGLGRVAQRALVALPGGLAVWFVNTHLHHAPGAHAARAEQVRRLLEWLEEAPRADAELVVGDFNTRPGEPAYRAMAAAGFASGYEAVHGEEPAVTWPSGIVADGMDTDGEPGCLDYAWLRGRARADAAWLVGTEAAGWDGTLFASDHFGVAAEVVVG